MLPLPQQQHLDDAEVLQALVEEFGEDYEGAQQRLVLNPSALSVVGRSVLRLGYSAAVAARRHQERTRLRSMRVPRKIAVSPRAAAQAAAALQTLYTNWMLGQTPLGKASRDLLLSEAQRERSIAQGHERNAEFYLALADRVPDGSDVQSSVPIQEAHRIRELVFREAP